MNESTYTYSSLKKRLTKLLGENREEWENMKKTTIKSDITKIKTSVPVTKQQTWNMARKLVIVPWTSLLHLFDPVT